MYDPKQLQALAYVIEEQSFERAAHRLHVTQSAISQRVKQLEEQLNQPLLLRIQPIQPTPAGTLLLKHYRQLVLLEQSLSKALTPSTPDSYSRLDIGVNADSLATWFMPALVPLLAQEKLLLNLKIDDQDATLNLLKQGEVIGCISSANTPLQGCQARLLGISLYRFVASPAYIQKHFPNGPCKYSLARAPIAEFNHKDALQHRYLQQFFQLSPSEYLCHRVPSSEAFLQLICHGLAAGMVPHEQAAPYLATGELHEVSKSYNIPVALYWHTWRLQSPLIDTLTQHITQAANAVLIPPKSTEIL